MFNATSFTAMRSISSKLASTDELGKYFLYLYQSQLDEGLQVVELVLRSSFG